jgi:hypothetical protein
LCETPKLVAAVIDALEKREFYIRYNSILILTTLLASHTAALQAAILAQPRAIALIMDLLNERNEMIRNEALLLLTGLTKAHAELTKLVAFEGAGCDSAFDKLLDIVDSVDEDEIIIKQVGVHSYSSNSECATAVGAATYRLCATGCASVSKSHREAASAACGSEHSFQWECNANSGQACVLTYK